MIVLFQSIDFDQITTLQNILNTLLTLFEARLYKKFIPISLGKHKNHYRIMMFLNKFYDEENMEFELCIISTNINM